MKQFGKILKFELKYYFKNKIFVGITVLLVFLIAAVMCFPRISGLFPQDQSDINTTENVSVMLVKAETSDQTEMVKEAFAAAFADYIRKCGMCFRPDRSCFLCVLCR